MLQIKLFINGQDATNRDNTNNPYVFHIQNQLKQLQVTHKDLFNKFPGTEITYRITQNGSTNRSIISLEGRSNEELQDLLQSVYPE